MFYDTIELKLIKRLSFGRYKMASEVVNEIVEHYFDLFITFKEEMKKLKEQELGER